MKVRNIHYLLLLILLGDCSSLKPSMVDSGDFNDAINNAIIDFVHRDSGDSDSLVYSVDYEYITQDIIGVSILEYSDKKVFITKMNSLGSNTPYFPTRIKEMDNRLFHWYDSSSVVTASVIQKLIEYDQIDSTRYFNPDFIEFAYDDNKKATHYYFCAQNLAKYIKKESVIALGYGKIPKIKCK